MTDLAQLAARVAALPCWRGPVEPEPLEGGLSNRNFRVRDGAEGFVVRIVGGDVPEHGILRGHAATWIAWSCRAGNGKASGGNGDAAAALTLISPLATWEGKEMKSPPPPHQPGKVKR